MDKRRGDAMYPMAKVRPDWTKINDQDAGDNGYVVITKGTAKLAKSSILSQMALDYYHNYGAAYQELKDILGD